MHKARMLALNFVPALTRLVFGIKGVEVVRVRNVNLHYSYLRNDERE